MKNFISTERQIGIIGGGQLGKMLAQAASNWDISTHILDESEEMPAAKLSTYFSKGSFRDYDTLLNFGRRVDLLTIEIESVNVEALKMLEQEGKLVYPSAAVLEIIQDKAQQNDFLAESAFPKARYFKCENKEVVQELLEAGKISFPFVQKLRRFGYDGRGVKIIRSTADLSELFQEPSIVEECVAIKQELSVIAARNPSGQIAVYEPCGMVFNPQANLLEMLQCPTELGAKLSAEAKELARSIADKIGIVGLLAVEMFLDQEDKLWINELAPRPHNSGHHTIEACYTSQYEQHLRCILDLPLGSTAVRSPSVLLNVLGEDGYSGAVKYEGLEQVLALEGVHMHIYGKRETKPFRKMGHVTVLGSSVEEARAKAELVMQCLKVIS